VIQGSDEQTILRYLHGELLEPEIDTLEERFFLDDDLHMEIQAVEIELIDRYIRKAMPPEERGRFEQKYMVTPERLLKVNESRSFRDVLDAVRAETAQHDDQPAVSWLERLFGNFSLSLPTMQYAAAGIIILMALGMAWLLYDRTRTQQELLAARNAQLESETVLTNELARKEDELRTRLAEQTRGESETLSALEMEIAELRRQLEDPRRQTVPESAPAPQAPVIATIFLPAVRGPGVPVNVVIARSAKAANVQVPVGDGGEGPFEIAITREAETVAAASGISPRRTAKGSVVSVSVPTRKLTEGRYEVNIRAQSGEEMRRAFVLKFK
jgi:hypothetical protein